MQQVKENTNASSQTKEIFSPPPIPPEKIQPIQPTPEKKQNKKLIIWIISSILLVFIVCAGIYYYYLEFQKPSQDAKQIIVFYEDIKELDRLLGGQNVQDTLDYVKVQDVLEKREEFLLRSQEKLLIIKPIKNIFPKNLSPRAYKITQTHQSLSELIELGIAANTDAKQKTVFLKDAYELLVALGRYAPRVQQAQVRENILDPRQPRAVKALLQDWETRIAKAKKLGDELFAKDLPQLNRADSLQLKTAWEKANEGFDDVLAYLRSKDQNSTISSQSILPQPQTAQEQQQYKGIEDVNQFIILLDSTFSNNNVQDILSYRFYNRQQDLGNIGSDFEKQITELKQQYPQEDQYRKTQEPSRPPQ